MEVMQIEGFFVILIGVCTFVVLLGNVVRTVKEWTKPAMDVAGRLDAHDDLLAKDNRRLGELEESNRLVLRAISQLIEHEVTGNHEAELKAVKDDINRYLINR